MSEQATCFHPMHDEDCECGHAPLASQWMSVRKRPVIVRAQRLERRTVIPTLEGVMVGEPGDYLIEGVSGELYPCKPDIFAKTYEAAK